MKSQKSLANAVTFEKYRKPTRREQFLTEMEQVVPWKELCALIEPSTPNQGRKASHRAGTDAPDPFPAELLQAQRPWCRRGPLRHRVHAAVCWHRSGNEPVPDETTICKFRHLLEAHGLGDDLQGGQRPPGVERTEALRVDHNGRHHYQRPSSRKNREKKRDPEMRSTKKHNQWYFGMKIHV